MTDAYPGPAGSPPPKLTSVMDGLRRDITNGAIPPGAHLKCGEIAAHYGTTSGVVVSALGRLRREGIVRYDRRRYATPAGPPDSAVNARMGAELRRLRGDAGLTMDELAATLPTPGWSHEVLQAHDPKELRAAEAGYWHPREFWEELDTRLDVGGSLLDFHDQLYAAPPDDAQTPIAALIATQIAATIRERQCPPGTRLPEPHDLALAHRTTLPAVRAALHALTELGVVTHDPGYYTPDDDSPRDPAPVPVAIHVTWNNGTHTQIPLHSP
jgi:DNA-binding GntR family transcriptional regulator